MTDDELLYRGRKGSGRSLELAIRCEDGAVDWFCSALNVGKIEASAIGQTIIVEGDVARPGDRIVRDGDRLKIERGGDNDEGTRSEV